MPSVAPKAAASSGPRWAVALAVLRLAVTLVLLLNIAGLAMAKDPSHQLATGLLTIGVTVVIGALPMVVARYRTLRGFSYTLLISAIVELLWQGSEHKKVVTATAVSEQTSVTEVR
jgi:hypothetical protein